jgi:hypothetical protein
MNPFEQAFVSSTELDIIDWETLAADLLSQGIVLPRVEIMIQAKKDMLSEYKKRAADRERLVQEANSRAIEDELNQPDLITTITKEQERSWWERFWASSG